MSEEPTQDPEVTTDANADEVGPRHHVTAIRTVERQVGDHIMEALENDDTVAVLTTIVGGVRTDRIVSVPLDAQQAQAVSEVLMAAQAEAQLDEADDDGRREGFLGFHAVLRKEKDAE
jgi:hypothetical protein